MSDSVRPHRRQPTRLPVPGILQARTLEWVAISFSNAWKVKEVAQSCLTLCDPMDCSLPGSSIHGIFQAKVLEWGAIAPSSPAPNSSQHQSLSNESTLCMRWPKYWSFSFSIIRSKEIPGLISFRMDWLDLLAVQGTLKSLLQHHSSNASILWHSAFFTVQLSHPYMTTGKTIALTRRTFVGKIMSLLLNMLSRLSN